MRRYAFALLVLAPLLAAAAPVAMLVRMSHGVTTTNMSLVLPDPSSTPGPTWASLLNTALTAVDSHDHTAGHGVQVPSAGVLHNADEAHNSHRLTGVQALQLVGTPSYYPSPLHLSSNGTDLFWVDGAGNTVQLSCSGGVCFSASGGINGNYASDGAHPSVFYTTSTKNYSLTSDGFNLAGVRVGRFAAGVATKTAGYTITDTDTVSVLLVDSTSGARTIVLPQASTNVGRILWFKDVAGTSSTNNISITRAGSALIDGVATKTINSAYGSLRLVCDGTNWSVL